MTKTTPKTIYDLELHEHLELGERMDVSRVPGGWLYIYSGYVGQLNGIIIYGVVTTTFVPYNNEFKPKGKNEVEITHAYKGTPLKDDGSN